MIVVAGVVSEGEILMLAILQELICVLADADERMYRLITRSRSGNTFASHLKSGHHVR